MKSKPEIIGVDHGYRNMKTARFCFPSAITELPSKPDSLEDILEYNGKFYSVSGNNILAVDTHDKSKSNEFYLLTLVSVAKELSIRNCSTKDTLVRIATGLPQKWYLDQKTSFKKMLMQNETLNFYYEGKRYNYKIDDVGVYTQGTSACLHYITEYKDDYFIIVDIGGETVDIIPVKKGRIVNLDARIDTKGMIWLYETLSDKVRTELYNEVDDTYIEKYINNGNISKAAQNSYEAVLQKGLCDYAESIMVNLKKNKINLDITPIVFVGGGGTVVKNFGKYNVAMTKFVDDISANAKGYELLETSRLKHR